MCVNGGENVLIKNKHVEGNLSALPSLVYFYDKKMLSEQMLEVCIKTKCLVHFDGGQLSFCLKLNRVCLFFGLKMLPLGQLLVACFAVEASRKQLREGWEVCWQCELMIRWVGKLKKGLTWRMFNMTCYSSSSFFSLPNQPLSVKPLFEFWSFAVFVGIFLDVPYLTRKFRL